MTDSFAVEWRPREPPLPPVAVAVRGPAARRLARRLLEEGRLGGFEGVVADDLLVLMGGDLPWVDGCTYLGRDARSPALLLPTTEEPTVPVEILERAVLQRFSNLERPLALLGPQVVPLGAARAVARGPLQAWVEES